MIDGSRPRPSPPLPDEWRRLEPLLDLVLDAAPDRRAALLAELTHGDPASGAELARLVAECESAFPLLERPAGERFASVFDDHTQPMPEVLGGRYRIVREIGRGGMAVVYLASDLKHRRQVAVKVVRQEMASMLGRSRFLQEIEIAARLRHPHIVPVYDSGEVQAGTPGIGPEVSVLYYVMPYEAGRSLRERLASEGSLPIDDAVLILRELCEALMHAHLNGIVHRDIKPENVLLSGRHAMITDFGVARAIREAASDAPLASAGLVFGTPAYMAPEQAANEADVDHRADIYAVGVLAYELLAGRTPFEPDLRRVPGAHHTPEVAVPLTTLRPDVPEALDGLVMKCLASRPGDRWQSADDMLARLSTIPATTGMSTSSRGPSRLTTGRRAVAFAGVGAAAMLVLAIGLTRGAERRAPIALGRTIQLTSEPGLEVQPSVSPDGRHVAYAEGHSRQMHIAMRPARGGKAVRLTTDSAGNAWAPRWSPDGARILFLARGGVFSVPVSGGPPREEVPPEAGTIITSATWSTDGREIGYVRGDSLLARTVGSSGVRLITTGVDLHSCTWSPDGERLACVSGNSFHVTVGGLSGIGPMFGNLAPSRIVLIPARGGPPVSVTDSGSLHQSPAWSRDGETLYYVSNRQGPNDVYALDVGTRDPASRPVRVTTGIGAQSITFSPDGARLVYAVYASTANIWAMPISAQAPGSLEFATQVTSGNQTVEGVRVSADGRWVIYDSDLSGNSDVYRVPVTGGDAVRLTNDLMDEFRGTLSPDGRELVYHSYQTGARNLYLLPLDGGPVQQLTRSSAQRSMANWSPDGKALALFDIGSAEVLVMRRDSLNRWSSPRFAGGSGIRPEWSPDGQRIAFVSPADGRISAVPADSGRQQDLYVPGAGDPPAELAIFSASGDELYFKSHDSRGRASFWSIPVAGGRPRLLALLNDPARASNRFEFASDGTRLYFTLEDRQSDIWVAEVATP